MEKHSIKICVGLSGGVDSSVAAYLLKQQGYDVFALFMQNWNDASTTLHGDCEWEEERFVAEMVARKIGIPFYFVDLSKPYRERVVDYMFGEYSKGRTPNPDVLCNREIKFDAFLQCARQLGADMVATGHYCRRTEAVNEDGSPQRDADGKPIYKLLSGSDPNKDQSYFLCQLSQEQLSAALFPIGDLLKPDVRRIAREADLPSADRKDSQGICFVGKVDLPTFLKQAIAPKEGDVVEIYDTYYNSSEEYLWQEGLVKSLDPQTIASLPDGELLRLSKPINYEITFETETYRSGKKHVKKTRYKSNPYGKIIGRHEGAQFYTIGQRKGLSIGGHACPMFVIATDILKNIIYLGEGESHKGLYRSCLRVLPEDVHWVRESERMPVVAGGRIPATDSNVSVATRRYKVRIRYRQPLQDATLVMRSEGLFIIFDEPQRGITPGQFAVWYANDGELVGSGVIN